MLNIAGVILVMIQFVIDGLAIYRGTGVFNDVSDVLGWFLFGLIGIALLIVAQAVSNFKISRAQRKAKEIEL